MLTLCTWTQLPVIKITNEEKNLDAITAGMSANYFVIHQLSEESSSSEWYEKLNLKGQQVNTKLDSGATCIVLPVSVLSFPS